MVIFSCSVKHAAVNFLAWEYGCFAPVCPSTMLGSIPEERDRGKITNKRIVDSLPDAYISLRFAAITSVLSEFSKDESFLLIRKTGAGKDIECPGIQIPTDVPVMLSKKGILPPRWLFTEPEVIYAYKIFQEELNEIEGQITNRNNKLSRTYEAYEVLLPSRIPCSIAI